MESAVSTSGPSRMTGSGSVRSAIAIGVAEFVGFPNHRSVEASESILG